MKRLEHRTPADVILSADAILCSDVILCCDVIPSADVILSEAKDLGSSVSLPPHRASPGRNVTHEISRHARTQAVGRLRLLGMALCALLTLVPASFGQTPNPVPLINQPLVPAAVAPGGPSAEARGRLRPAATLSHTQAGQQTRLAESYGKLPLSFEANLGQTDARVKFLSRGRGYTLFLTGDEAVLSLRSQEPGVRSQPTTARNWKFENRNWPEAMRPLSVVPGPLLKTPSATGIGSIADWQLTIDNSLAPSPDARHSSLVTRHSEALRLKLVGANPRAKVVELDPLPGKSNYFIGNDPKKWRTNVPNYSKVKYESVYPGIDVVYYGNQGQLEYDFVVRPGADPGAVKLVIEGTEDISFDEGGNLVAKSNGGDIVLNKPTIYQNAAFNPKSKITNPKFVGGRYTLVAKNQVAFEVGPYDRTRPLVIDPALSYSTYLGGGSTDSGEDIAVDSSGNAYVTGWTEYSDFPTVNPFQPALAGSPDAFVSKLNAAGNALVYSTYLGGSNVDYGFAIALDTSGNAYLTGYTGSTDFPTMGPLQGSNAGGSGAYVTKLNAAGDALVYSTYLGGNGSDGGLSIAVDSSGNAYVTGWTELSGFPTVNPFQPALAGGLDAFVSKLNAAGNALVYSTYLGGFSSDEGRGIAVDSSGNAYVTGYTPSSDFPTRNPLQPSLAGGLDAFVAKLNAAGNALVYSTYLGGSADDVSYGIAIDSSGNAYVTGYSRSGDFPTLNPVQPAYGGGLDDAFVAELNTAGNALVYSTYLGGSADDVSYGITVDSSGNAYVTGTTESPDFPTLDPVQPAYGGGLDDAFVAELNTAGNALVYSTYLGGSSEEEVYATDLDSYAIAVDSSGNAYVTGTTGSSDFPTLGPLQPSLAGSYDAFVAKIGPGGVSLTPASLSFGIQLVSTTSPTRTLRFHNGSSAGLNISGISITGTNSGEFAETNACGTSLEVGGTCNIAVTFTPTSVGDKTAAVTVSDDAPGSPHTASLTGTGINPAVSLSATMLDFGNQALNVPSAPQNVTLTNSGVGPLTITNLTASGDFAVTNTCGTTVAEGAQCTITVTFTPTMGGTRLGTVTITDNAANSPQSINLTGTGIPATITLSTTSLTFADQNIGTTSPPQPVTVTNSGNVSLLITSIATTGDYAETHNCPLAPATIAPSASCTINVTFTPTATGTRLGTLTLTDNASGSPQSVSLSGTGLPTTVSVAPASLDFGDQRLGTTSPPQPVTVTNTGGGPLTISGISASGNFARTHNCPISPATLVAGNSCTVNVTFTPTARGTRTGTLTLNDNGAGSPHTVALTGNGIAPDVGFSPAALNFPDQAVGVPGPPQDLLLTNTGNTVLNMTGILATIPFAEATNCAATLNAGASCTISVNFTASVPGTTYGALIVSDDAPGSPHTASLTGTTAVSFADQLVGQSSAPQTVTLSNMSNAPRVISGITTTGDFAKSGACGTIQPGASCSVGVTFTPTAPGTRTGALVVADNAPGSPHAMTLTGIGIGPGVSFSANPLSFGGEILGTTSSPKTVAINNSGNQPLSITSIAVSGDYAQAASTCILPQTLAAGTGCSVDITFTPTVMGDRPGAVTVTDNAAGSPHTAALTGKGTDFVVATASGGSTSATVAAGGTATYRLSIAPTGFVGTVALACTGAPPRATCAPSLNSVMLDGANPSTFTIIVKTTARAMAPSPPAPLPPPAGEGVPISSGRVRVGAPRPPLQDVAGQRPALQVWLIGLMLSLGLVAAWRRRGQVRDLPLQWRRPIGPSLLAAMVLLVVLWVACGGGGGGGGGNTGTPPGTYSLTVTATYGSASRSLSLNLVVN